VGRLFWTFPDGLPGAGLVLLRLAIGAALLGRCLTNMPVEPALLAALCVAEGLAAVLLWSGLGTRVCGAGVAAAELWRAYSDPVDVFIHVLLAALGAALALLGPGAFSIDARIFGWRRIDAGRPSKGSNDDSN